MTNSKSVISPLRRQSLFRWTLFFKKCLRECSIARAASTFKFLKTNRYPSLEPNHFLPQDQYSVY